MIAVCTGRVQMKKNKQTSWIQLDFPCKLKDPLLPCLMKLFSTSLRILWQPGRRKQLCKKKQFLLMCYTTTLHCFQILACPEESITESGKWLIRQQKDKILQRFFKTSLYYQKSWKHIERFLKVVPPFLDQGKRSIIFSWAELIRPSAITRDSILTLLSCSESWECLCLLSLWLPPRPNGGLYQMMLRCCLFLYLLQGRNLCRNTKRCRQLMKNDPLTRVFLCSLFPSSSQVVNFCRHS